MKKSLFAVLVISALLPVQYLWAQARWGGRAMVSAGYESNIYKSPDQVESRGDTLDPVVSDRYLGIEVDLGAKYDLGSRHQFGVSYRGDEYRFGSNDNVDQYRHEGNIDYRLKAGKDTYFYLNSSVGYLQKLGTSVLGEGLTRLYSSRYFLVEPRLRHNTTERLKNDLEYIFKYRNYDETPGYQSIDYREHEVVLGSQYDLFNTKFNTLVELILGYRNRQYIEYSGRDNSGNLSNNYPKRQYTYYEITLGYETDLKWIDLAFSTRYRQRRDGFEDYYSYNEWRLWSRAKGRISEKLSYNLYLSWKDRGYLEKTARQNTGTSADDPTLFWKNIDFKMAFEYQLTRILSLETVYSLDTRDTNVTDILARTNREYADHNLSLSLIVDF